MEKELNITQMEILNIKVIGLMIKLMEMENIFGKMVNIIQVNLKMDLKMEKELNIIQIKIFVMKVIGLMIKEKEMENIFGKMVNIIQVNLKMD